MFRGHEDSTPTLAGAGSKEVGTAAESSEAKAETETPRVETQTVSGMTL